MASERDHIAARERREWIKQEFENENRQQYEKYLKQEQSANSKVAPAHRVEPASFEEFSKAMPEGEPDADVRGLTASSVVTLRRLGKVAIDRISSAELSDEELTLLGYDPEDRVVIPEALSVPGIADAFRHFAKSEKRYVADLHYFPISDFTVRNKLFPSDNHIRLTFNHLWDLHLLPEPRPEPQPERPEGTNEYGVNLIIERDPVLEARQRREKYEREIVVIDPENGKGWTEYQLDHLADSETYRRLLRIPRVYKNPALEPKH